MITLGHQIPSQRHAVDVGSSPHVLNLGMSKRFRDHGAALRPIKATCDHMVPVLGPLLPHGRSLGTAECRSRAFGSVPLMDPVSNRRESWAWCSWAHRSQMVIDMVRAGFRVPHQRQRSA